MISKIHISEHGRLMIQRAGKFVYQVCPYSKDACGDQCPMFGEPIFGDETEGVTTISVLPLCHSHRITFLKEEFEDAREGADASV